MPAAAAQHDRDDAGRLGRELQPARMGQREPAAELAHHAPQAAMAQPFLHRQQHAIRAAGLRDRHPVRMQPHLAERRREQAGALDDPQHHAAPPGQHSGRQQRGGTAMLDIRPRAGHLVQRPAGKACAGKAASIAATPNGMTLSSAL